ncbi:glycosyltransferase [Rhizobium sp. L1K21]|uniref:glycosyltransferase n=1 Tax=Rhizobium sp. L1K21 TaxID=2954933 RepID=UPI002092FC51|nr:glycosyltransferase [Rhizobium sp. L1K21]MCO6187958.1 glycosyltransferase [Rhizobium sp. L1K21]
MDFVSYSQNLEDVVLDRVFSKVQAGLYIDIGAKGPTLNSATKALYEAGWSGINIEPNPKRHALLLQRRPRDVNLRAFVGNMSEQVETELAAGTSAPRQTLDLIWKTHVPDGTTVHLLKIDAGTNGHEIIASNDWVQHRPWVVLVRSRPSGSSAESLADLEATLVAARYRMVLSLGSSKFYLADEHAELADLFSDPSKAANNIPLYDVIDLEVQLQEAEDAADKLTKKLKVALDSNLAIVQQTNALRADLQRLHKSLSWRLTQPLRQYNPKQLLYVIIRHARVAVARNPVLANSTRALVHKMPIVHTLLRKAMGTDHPSGSLDFVNLKFGRFTVDFCSGPLGDARGIGRVAREQFSKLRERETTGAEEEAGADNVPNLHFYTSIHWCPPELPEKSVIMIHDVIPLIFRDIFPRSLIWEWEGRLKSAAAQAEHIVTISHANLEKISTLLEVDQRKISVVHNGVTQLPVDYDNKLNLPKKPYLVFVGSQDYHKNLKIVLQAMKETVAKDVELALVGDNSGILDYAKKLGVHSRLSFLGKCTDGELGYALSKSCGLVFPSLYEGFGLPPMEAALLGVPSICSDRPAMNEMLSEGVVFCDPEDPREWAQAMSLLTHEGLPQAAVQNARKCVETEFNWDRSVDNLLQILQRVAAEN